MNSIWTFRSTMGLFVYGKWRPIFSAIINIVISILFAKSWWLWGVSLGTTFTRVVTNVWYDPYIVFKHGLKKKPFKFFKQWIYYLLIVFCLVFVIRFINNIILLSGALSLIFNIILSTILFLSTIVLIFRKTSVFNYFMNIIKSFISKTKWYHITKVDYEKLRKWEKRCEIIFNCLKQYQYGQKYGKRKFMLIST